MALFDMTVCADLGSAATKLSAHGKVSVSETRAALDPENCRRVLAVGDGSRKLLGATPAYPVRGCVSDIPLAALLLRRLALDLLGRRSLFGAELLLAVPGAATGVERAAALEVGCEAGFKRTRLIDGLLAGALGAGLDVFSRRAQMIVNIGRETLSTAVFANGGVISQSVSRTGSTTVDRRLMDHFASERRLLITSRTAEAIKRSLDRPAVSVSCRDVSTGMHTVRRIVSHELREAAGPALALMCGRIAAAIEAAPPDAAADLCDSGVTLIGGGALQYGLAESFERRLGIPVRTAEGAQTSVVMGMKECAELGAGFSAPPRRALYGEKRG
ncbi:MAG: rod shape-determining protein [Clostridia bacterium]|nr:rod shape-determining protein [Clostridia bacterium]